MAFNPFEAFSIRSKLGRSVMAVLGIVVMLTFVLSTGAVGSRNDFFDQVGMMFSSRSKGDLLATGFGDDIHAADLEEVRRQRLAARDFLQSASQAAYTAWARELDQDLSGTRYSTEFKEGVKKVVSLRANIDKDQRAYETFLQDFFRFGQDAQKLSEALRKAREKPESEEKKAADAIAAIILNDLGPSPLYLIELGDSEQDLLDFILLQKKADQLGIKLSSSGVEELIARDTAGRLRPEEGARIQRRMRESGRYGDLPSDWLATALASEYQARAALFTLQGESPLRAELRHRVVNSLPGFMLLGADAATATLPGGSSLRTMSAMPGTVTPYEFFEFYKDRCSEHTFALLELKAEQFVDRVTEEPTDAEKRALFNRYRGELPDPSKDRPGFKQPKRLKVEYVTMDATAPRVAQAIPPQRAASTFLCLSAGAIAGNPAAAMANASQPGLAESLPVKEIVAEKMEANLSRYQAFDQYVLNPRDVSVFRPQPIIALLGGFGGYPAPTAAAVPIALSLRHIEAHDHQTRIPFLLQGWLTPFNPTLGNALGMPAFAYALNPKLPSEGLYLADAVKEVQKRQRQAMFEADVRELEDKLRKLVFGDDPLGFLKPDKAKQDKGRLEAQKYLAEWLKARGLTPAGTTEPVDQFGVVSSPNLKVLNELAAVEPDGTNSLSRRLFPPDNPQNRFPTSDVQPFSPFWFPGEPAGDALDRPNHLVWVSEEVEPKTFNTLQNADALTNGEMSKRVVRAWKLEKARGLARAEADRLAEQVKPIGKSAATDRDGAERQLRDLAAQRQTKLFELDRLATLKFQHEPTQARMGYEEPKIDKALVPYPTPDFAGQLLELRKQPTVGGVTVLADAPRDRFYVACEMARFERTPEQFRDVFVKSTATGPALNPLYNTHALPEARGEAMDVVRARLRAEAKLEETEAFKNRSQRSSPE